jgi:hypothetical protein
MFQSWINRERSIQTGTVTVTPPTKINVKAPSGYDMFKSQAFRRPGENLVFYLLTLIVVQINLQINTTYVMAVTVSLVLDIIAIVVAMSFILLYYHMGRCPLTYAIFSNLIG